LLDAARQAQIRGRSRHAARSYRRVIHIYPATAAAGAASVALGRLLHVELQQPSAAVPLFESYLRRHPHGALTEEALYFRALALTGLGHAGEAATDLQRLLRSYPASVYAVPARARLVELNP
jgi:outer membrane protein assembly factor BamD (BamD/ComL family)